MERVLPESSLPLRFTPTGSDRTEAVPLATPKEALLFLPLPVSVLSSLVLSNTRWLLYRGAGLVPSQFQYAKDLIQQKKDLDSQLRHDVEPEERAHMRRHIISSDNVMSDSSVVPSYDQLTCVMKDALS